ncbi:MAG: hypothetical protein RIS29_3208 [Bacteroidota bacterium]
MKKTFTLGIFLALIMGIGSNAEAATFTSRLSAIAGVPTSTSVTASNNGLRIGAWNAKTTWYDPTQVDTSSVSLPTYNDDVIISTGDSIYLGAAAYSRNITVNGTLCLNSGAMYINGDLTVNPTGIFSIKSSAYCKNVYNYGKIWAWSTNYNTARAFCVGYTNQGTSATTVASADSITIYNDGIIGGSRSIASAGGNGCGFYVYYSNQAKALNITGSTGTMPNRTFNAGGLVPGNSVSGTAASTAATQNFNLYIRNGQSLAFFVSASPSITSLQNGDVFTGYTRTCTIEQGASMYVATSFHCKAAAPTASQGAMIYNIFGTLDLGTYNRSKNEFDLYTSAGSSSVTVNVKNGGTLVFGKVIALVQSAAGQTTALNAETGSTVKFGYTSSAPTITTTVASVATPTLFPTSYSNLEFATSTYNTTLPAGQNFTVGNTLTMTSGKVILGTSTLTANSITGASSSSYVVTDGAGTLTIPASAATSTLLPIGASATSYDPVTVNAASASNISAKVSATLSGTANTGIYNNAKEWTLASSAPSATLLTFKPSAEDASVNSTLSFSVYNALIGQATGTATYTNYSAAYASGSYSATFSTFGSFVTGANSLATALKNGSENALSVFAANKSVLVKNAKAGELVTVYSANGARVASSVLNSDNATLPLSAGIYMVKVGATTTKVAVF